MAWELMSHDEIHKFGIKSILPYIQKEGFEIEGVNDDPRTSPQVVGTVDSQKAFLAVKTAMYPEKGVLSQDEKSRFVAWARQQGGVALFASVGLACMNYPDKSEVQGDADMSKPIKNGGFAVSYQGFQPVEGH